MSLEHRGKAKSYYRVRRKNGRFVKEYVASGEAAEEAAKRDAEERARREEIARINAMLTVLDEVCEMAIEVTMIAAGYHRHDRGPWRKKRVKS